MATKPNITRILAVLAALFVMFAIAGPSFAQDQPDDYPLKGLRFPAYAGEVESPAYDLYVEANGRLWQAWLPIGPQRVAHSVSFELPEGDYVFNGVICALYIDPDRNGNGSANPATAANGNDLEFSVTLPADADYGTAWALVECEGGSPSGFDIWALNWEAPPSASANPQAPDPTALPEDRMDEPIPAAEIDEACASGSRDGEFLCDPAGNWVYTPSGATTEPPTAEEPETPFAELPLETQQAVCRQMVLQTNPSVVIDGVDCFTVLSQVATPAPEPPAADDGTTPTEKAVDDPIVPPYWANRPWLALLPALIGLLLAAWAGQKAYKAWTPPTGTSIRMARAIFWTVVAAVGSVVLVVSMIWFF